MKLCDFGYCIEVGERVALATGVVGTPLYIAPEILGRTPYDAQISDVWSVGVLLYTLLMGSYPFLDSDCRCEVLIALHNIFSQNLQHVVDHWKLRTFSSWVLFVE